MDSELEELPPVPPVPDAALETWKREVEPRAQSEKVKKGLRFLLAGYSYRDASHMAGYAPDAGRTALHDAAVRFGIKPFLLDSKTLQARERSIIQLSGMEQEKRLLETPEKVSDRDLSVMRGIGWDKVAMYEGWKSGGASDSTDAVSAFSKLADALAAGEMKLEMKIEPSQRPERVTDPVTIEVEKKS